MLALAGANRDERHIKYNPTSVFVGSFHMYVLNTYFMPGSILDIEHARQNMLLTLVCVCRRQTLTKKMDKYVLSADEKLP